MPTIDSIAGIKFNIYYGDHLPPHIHALYNEHEALVVIRTGDIYAGRLPKAQMKTVQGWLSRNRTSALQIFQQFNPGL